MEVGSISLPLVPAALAAALRLGCKCSPVGRQGCLDGQTWPRTHPLWMGWTDISVRMSVADIFMWKKILVKKNKTTFCPILQVNGDMAVASM